MAIPLSLGWANSPCVESSRQTLLSTYLFYQSLSYMGRSAPALLARLERGQTGLRARARALDRLLGGIEVLVETRGGGWRTAGEHPRTHRVTPGDAGGGGW